jgi:hypothetical protein
MLATTADLETVSTGLEAGNVNGEPGLDCAQSGSCRKMTAITAGQGFSDVMTFRSLRRRAAGREAFHASP